MLENINWLQPSLGIPTNQLLHLFNILQGDLKLHSPWSLTKEAPTELKIAEEHIKNAFLNRAQPNKFNLI